MPVILIIILFQIQSCSETRDSEIHQEDPVEAEVVDMHTAQISLDYYGYYEGVLPCASCEGVETKITLKEHEDQFRKEISYLGKDDDSSHVFTGNFVWNDAGNTITLVGESEPNQYFVMENALRQLDVDGNRIEGELAEMYILRKKK